MRVLITGGAGTLGKALCSQLINDISIKSIIVFERSEQNHARLMATHPSNKFNHIVGDIRDYESVLLATRNVDLIIHTAAMKHIDLAEENSLEATSINVMGTYNIIKAAKVNNVPQTFFISTDKASSPTGVYGTSKLMGEKMITSSSTLLNKMSVFRFGNLIGSSGSIFEKWPEQVKNGKKISVTNSAMTRFFINTDDAAKYIISKIENQSGGEIFIPKMHSKKIMDIALSFVTNPDQIEITGLRKKEKIHETLISKNEMGQLVETESEYIIFPGSDYLKDIISN